MFDGFFKPKFYSKCKSLVKLTKTRVDAVKRKKIAVCKYLKNDIADLLKDRLDNNAYSRIEGLIVEKKRLSCYELLEQFCSSVGSNVSLLQKTSGCPEECREAISSLIYAAARVSEVPELRDLRHLFSERYGSSLEQFVSQELVEKFKVEPPSKEMKLQLMHEIAREYSIQWDSKSLEQNLYTPPPPEATLQTEGNHGPVEDAAVDTRETRPKTKKNSFEEKTNHTAKEIDLSLHRRRSSIDEKNKFVCNEDESTEMTESSVGTSSVSTGVMEDEQESIPFYYRFIPTTNIKSKIEQDRSFLEEKAKPDARANNTESATGEKPKPRSVRRRFAKPPPDEKNGTRPLGLGDIVEDSVYPLKPPPASSMSLRTDSLGKTSGTRKLSRRTVSWQPPTSSEIGDRRSFELTDFDEMAARVDALRRL